jgi:GT2 family glycosyltransferase
VELSIIIVNYNVQYFLEQCLYSVLLATKNIRAEILVIDNASTDDSRTYLPNRFPSVNFTWCTENVGFSKANNIGIKKATGDHILFLNPDTIVGEDCFEKCLAYFKTDLTCGAIGLKMIDGSGNYLKESKRSFPSPLTSFYKLAGLATLFPASPVFARYYAGHLPNDQVHEVDVLAGACMMLRRKALEKVGGFDEDYFMYGEDVDLSYRLQQEGFKNVYFPGATIIHFKGESTQKLTWSYVHHFYDAMKLFVGKHYRNRKSVYYSMRLSVTCSKGLATVKMFLKKLLNPLSNMLRKRGRPAQLFVMASPVYFNDLVQLIKFAEKPLLITGRLSAGNYDMQKLVKSNGMNILLLCNDGMGISKMIQLMEGLHQQVEFLVHIKGSNSIVGSNDKNAKGIFIAGPSAAEAI